MAYGLVAFEVVRGNSPTGGYAASPLRIIVEGSGTASGTRAQAIMPGRLIVLDTTDNAADGIRGSIDTVANQAGARKILGLCKNVLDDNGRPLRVPYLAATDSGIVEYWPAEGLTLRGVEDAVGGAMTGTGSVGQVDGTPAQTTATDGVLGSNNPIPKDKLDSSTRSATATQQAFQIIELDPREDNNGTAKVYDFKINSAYIANVA